MAFLIFYYVYILYTHHVCIPFIILSDFLATDIEALIRLCLLGLLNMSKKDLQLVQ